MHRQFILVFIPTLPAFIDDDNNNNSQTSWKFKFIYLIVTGKNKII